MRLQENWTSFYTLYRREFVRIVRIWPQTILPPVITMALYFVIFGTLIGPRIGTINGFKYVEYIMPGLVMMAIINNAYLNVCSSFFGNKFQRNIEEMLVAPMPNSLILAGYVCGGIVRGVIVGFFVIMVSLFFTDLQAKHWIVTLLIALLTATLFSLAGLLNGILAKKFDDISIVPVFVLTPLTYLGGVFYSVSVLSPFWQAATYANPIFYMVNGFRYGIIGASDVPIFSALWIIIGSVIILYFICLWLLNKGIGVKS